MSVCVPPWHCFTHTAAFLVTGRAARQYSPAAGERAEITSIMHFMRVAALMLAAAPCIPGFVPAVPAHEGLSRDAHIARQVHTSTSGADLPRGRPIPPEWTQLDRWSFKVAPFQTCGPS